MAHVVIVGGNRGLGYELTQQFVQGKCDVIATYQDKPSEELKALNGAHATNLKIVQLESRDLEEIQRFAKTIEVVDILVINVLFDRVIGYHPHVTAVENTAYELQEVFKLITVAPDNFIRAFYPVLQSQKDASVAFISSLAGSTKMNLTGGFHPLRVALAATHALMWNWNIKLIEDWTAKNPNVPKHAPFAIAICKENQCYEPVTVQQNALDIKETIEKVRQTKFSQMLYDGKGLCLEMYEMTKEIQGVITQRIKHDTDPLSQPSVDDPLKQLLMGEDLC
jgi:hypothetical protein